MSMTTREVAKYIDAFKYWCETNEENGVITLPKFLCDNIVEILDDTNARPHGEWIRCSERLPEKDGKYLVTKLGYVSQKPDVTTAIFVSSTKEFYPDCIAWMPLPEPYKKEGEAE